MKYLNKLGGIILLVYCVNYVTLTNQEQSYIVETTYGKIEGTILQTIQNPKFHYYAFMGIPYALPPLKNLRFKPPLRPTPWTTTKKCQKFGSPCLQISKINGSILGNENCLTLNIFTREINTTNLKPVMFWIHGGAHIRGSSSEFGPDYLVEKPIVLVTVNYRLNIFGFLSVNDANVYGNAALKDQIVALEWVQDNIAKFGGDSKRVTIFGESSGADCVCLLQLSRRTKGLYHQIIAQSGSALNSRYLQRNPLKYVHNIATYFNVSTDSNADIIEGLQNIDAVELIRAANSTISIGYSTNLKAAPFYPIIEAENNEAVISRGPYQLIETNMFNNVTFIIGYNSNEGTLGLDIANSEMNIDDFDKQYYFFAPDSLNNEKNENVTGAIVRNYFLGNSSAKNTKKFSKFLGQELLVRGIRKNLDFQRQSSSGYFYRFSYKGTHTTKYEGVGHGEELQYLFAKDGSTKNLSKCDILTRKRMVEMWTNFAIFGSPIPDGTPLSENVYWKKTDKNSIHFLDIGKNLVPGTSPEEEKDYEFWNQIFDRYGIKPYQTF